jgi:hypothetical protein
MGGWDHGNCAGGIMTAAEDGRDGLAEAASWWLAMRAGEPEVAGRLAAYRAARPDVIIGEVAGEWQARISSQDSEITITRHTLGELIGVLETGDFPVPDTG